MCLVQTPIWIASSRCVYSRERAQVAEGQGSKWPDESVTLGKFHFCVGGGSNMSAGKSVVIALTQRDNAKGGSEIQRNGGWTANALNPKSLL